MSTELVRAVHEARKLEEVTQQVISLSQMAWAATNADILALRDEAKEKRAKAEEALREAALTEYAASGSKQPFPGVGIRVREKVVYKPETALMWANKHHMALLLDTKVFEKLMKDMPLLPSWVSLEEDATATIATDLGKALEEKEEICQP